jgi:hypothetical protein
MSELVRKSGRGVVAGPQGNPDGKGLNGFLLDWYRTEPRGLVAKPQRQILAEFFTSMLVLSAEFKYEPTIGVTNYLYCIGGRWQLSLIGPHEWSDERRRGYVGACVLQPDQTWTIEPSSQLRDDDTLRDEVARFYEAFDTMLDTDQTLEDILPFYVRRLPYWQRLHASALSRSIRGAVTLGDQTQISARNWRIALPSVERMLALI